MHLMHVCIPTTHIFPEKLSHTTVALLLLYPLVSKSWVLWFNKSTIVHIRWVKVEGWFNKSTIVHICRVKVEGWFNKSTIVHIDWKWRAGSIKAILFIQNCVEEFQVGITSAYTELVVFYWWVACTDAHKQSSLALVLTIHVVLLRH